MQEDYFHNYFTTLKDILNKSNLVEECQSCDFLFFSLFLPLPTSLSPCSIRLYNIHLWSISGIMDQALGLASENGGLNFTLFFYLFLYMYLILLLKHCLSSLLCILWSAYSNAKTITFRSSYITFRLISHL